MSANADDTAADRRRSGSRRDDAARLAVLHAADDLLVENGFAALTIESIARRAGVAKQTIYRWWSSKGAILLDTLIEDSEKRLPVPSSPATSDGIRRYFRAFARFVTADPAGAVLLALIAEAQHDRSAERDLRERYLDPRRARERAMIRRAIRDGVVTTDLEPDAALDAIAGPIVLRAMTGTRVSRGYVDLLVELLLGLPGRAR